MTSRADLFIMINVGLFCFLCGCGERREIKISPITTDEYCVITNAIHKMLGDSVSTGAVAILHNTTHVNDALSGFKGYSVLCDELRAAGKERLLKTAPFLKECIEDFISKNTRSWPIRVPQGGIDGSLLVMSEAEIDKAFLGDESGKTSQPWDSLKKNRPGIEAVVKVSRVGLSTDGEWAMLCLDMKQGELSGGAEFVVLKKVEDRWELQSDSMFFGRKIVY